MTQPFDPTPGQAAVQQQVSGISADLGPGPQASPADLVAVMAAEGAHAAEVDSNALLASIRALQARVDAMEAEKKKDLAPAVMQYAQAIADHAAAKVAANPVLALHPDNPITGVTGLAQAVVAGAQAVIDGNTGALQGPLSELEAWVGRHAKGFPHIDWSYVLQLAEEAAGAAVKLAA